MGDASHSELGGYGLAARGRRRGMRAAGAQERREARRRCVAFVCPEYAWVASMWPHPLSARERTGVEYMCSREALADQQRWPSRATPSMRAHRRANAALDGDIRGHERDSAGDGGARGIVNVVDSGGVVWLIGAEGRTRCLSATVIGGTTTTAVTNKRNVAHSGRLLRRRFCGMNDNRDRLIGCIRTNPGAGRRWWCRIDRGGVCRILCCASVEERG
jgi:hypothetical protein